jgi:glycosyltransferase involved in cell wall biosynthesis
VAMAEGFPDADIFTLFCDEKTIPVSLSRHRIIPSALNWLPAKYRLYRHMLPLYPMGFEAMDLRGYDLVLSSDSALAKGVILDQGSTHVCYCHSPMRCLYDQSREYIEDMPWYARPVFRIASHYLRVWDFVAAQRVDLLLANSGNVAQRIRSYYNLPSQVIYPPVQTQAGYLSSDTGDYFLSVSRLTPPKRVDLLIEACNRLGKRLIIVGKGRERTRLLKLAGSTIEFEGHVTDHRLKELYAQCRAFLFAANEDFGIVPVEAQSYGRPVIAYGTGGSLETVIEGQTGVYFREQTVSSVVDAIERFELIESTYEQQAAELEQDAQRNRGLEACVPGESADGASL